MPSSPVLTDLSTPTQNPNGPQSLADYAEDGARALDASFTSDEVDYWNLSDEELLVVAYTSDVDRLTHELAMRLQRHLDDDAGDYSHCPYTKDLFDGLDA
jgi:hypothetical protein